MSLLIRMILSATGPRTLKRFREQCSKPGDTQDRLLDHIVRENEDTAFGKAHGFSSIRSFKDFQRQVPVATYDDLSGYIEATLNGEPAQLTKERPVLFATTSGTTGASKFIPVTPASRSAKSQLMRVWMSAVHRDHAPVFSGRILVVVSPEVESYSPCGIPCGAESGHGYKNVPNALKPLYACPYEVYELKDYDAKYYTLLRLAAEHSIRLIYTCNPSTVLLLAKRLGDYTEHIVRDIRDGTLSRDFDVPDKLRKILEPGLRADRSTAARLEKAAAADGCLLPRTTWPEMRAIGCWKGGTVGSYIKKFGRYFSEGLPVRDIGYFASEHRGSVPISDEGDAGVMAVPTNVYEFFPAEEDRKPGPEELLRADQLEDGKRYFVYVTTHSGLYRYNMADIIEIAGFYERTPLIRFVQKGKGVVSFTGEKLYESQAIAAVGDALESCKGHYEFIAAVGEMPEDKPRYVFLVEFDDPPSPEEGKAMADGLDGALRKHNMEYGSKRDSLRLDPPVVRVIRRGEFEKYRKRMVDKGKLDGQFKILRLTTDTAFAKEFEALTDIVAGETAATSE